MGNRIFAPDASRSLLFIGDTHIGDNPSARWTKFADAFLADSFRPAGIVHIGDLTDQSDAASVNLAKAWIARFPNPKTLVNGDHDLLNGVTLAQWQTDYSTQEFKTVDFGFVAVITTTYLIDTARRDAIIAAANAVSPKPVFLATHRPLRDTTTAGVAPHDNLSASAPNYSFATDLGSDTNIRAAFSSATNMIAGFSGHSHAWLDDPGCAIRVPCGTRQIPYVNTSAITYVGGSKQFYSDPIIGIIVTLKADNKTIEVRYRDYGGNGVWTYWDKARGRTTTLTATTAAGTTYYVSPTGSNANNGTSTGTPWQTVAFVNSQSFGPGDSILFQGGQSFTGPLTPPSSGSSTSPITFGSYGTGRATITNTGAGHGCVIGARSNLVIDGINFTGPGAATSTGNGVQMAHSTTTRPTNITVRNSSLTGWKRGVSLEFPVIGTPDGVGYDSVLIEDCVCSSNRDQGVASYGYDRLFQVGVYPHTNITVRRVQADSNVGITTDNGGFPSGDGIVLGGVNGGLITLCRATNNGQSAFGGPVGIWCFDSNAVVIDKCIAYNNGTNSSSDGGGFDLDINCTNCTIQYCLAYDNEGYGLLCYQDATWGVQWNSNTIRWNVFWGNAKVMTNHAELLISGTNVGSVNIYNNTFVAKDNAANTLHPPALGLGTDASGLVTPTGITVRNNIFKQLGSGLGVSAAAAYTTSQVLMQGNAYDKAGAMSVKWGATTYTTLATWRAAVAGQEQVSGTNTGVVAATNLVAPSTAPTATDPNVSRLVTGIRYNAGSPVQNAGLDLQSVFGIAPGGTDYEGSSLITPYSIGAIR